MSVANFFLFLEDWFNPLTSDLWWVLLKCSDGIHAGPRLPRKEDNSKVLFKSAVDLFLKFHPVSFENVESECALFKSVLLNMILSRVPGTGVRYLLNFEEIFFCPKIPGEADGAGGQAGSAAEEAAEGSHQA